MLILTTLVTGTVAGLSIESPNKGDVFDGSSNPTIEVSGEGSGYSLWYNNGSAWVREANNVTTNETIPLSSLDSGSYDVRANNTNEEVTITLGVDTLSPKLSSTSPDVTSETSPTVEVTFDRNGEAQLSWVEINVTDSESTRCDDFGDSNTYTCSFSPDLSEGSYDVDWSAEDEVGNSNSNSFSFDIDTTADFDLGLSSGDFDPEPGTIEMDGDQDVDITLEDLGEDGTAYCYDQEGDEIDSQDVNDGTDVDFTCEFDEDDYGATTTTVEVEVCDEVENCETADDMYDFSFDRYSPTVSNLETDSGASSFNSEFDVTFEVSDDVSDIDQVEYYFNTFVDPDEGTEFGYSEDTSTYSVDPSSLDDGDHTLKVRAKDEVGRWSDVTELDFSYYPDRTPSVSLDTDENITVDAGSSASLNVELTNDGEIFIPSVTVDVSGGFVSSSKDVSELAPGDTVNPVFDIEPSEKDLGSYELTVSTESPSSEQTVDLLVRANEQQREDINSTLQEYQSKLQELNNNVTQLRSSGLAEERNQRLEENFTAFKSTVEDAQEAVDSGEYYRADEILSGVDRQYTAASDTYTTVKKEEQRAQTRQMMLMALLGVVVLVSSGIGYIAYSDRYDLDLDAIEEKVQGVLEFSDGEDSSSESGDSGLVEKFKGFLGEESEAEEFEWDGFERN